MDQNLGLIWERCLKFMRDNLSAAENEDVKKLEHSFDLLFDKVEPLSLVNHNLTLLVPSDFYKEYIEENYLALLSSALKKNIGKGVKLWYSVMENKPQGKEKPTLQNYKGISVQAPKVQEVRPASFSGNVVNPFVVPGIKKVNIDSNLNPNLNFDNFVEGESNKFASTVAKTIAKRPGATSFNPLFIHGGVGVGKTHLAHAIGLDIKTNFPDKIILYLSSEKFIQQFVSAAKAQNKTDFGNFYQMVDVLIIDDIQFLSGKAATQDMFFHIFDHLHQTGKQIILTSDKAPADIQDIQERIVSRFKWGLSASEKSPYYDIAEKYGVKIDFRPFIKVESLSAKEFRQQKISVLDHTAVIFTSRHAIDHFFHLCTELRVTIPETMKYFCVTEAVALYIQKYVQYRKRKIFFGNTGKIDDLIPSIVKHKTEKYVPRTDHQNYSGVR
jgi:chromosomal replication initiator protein